MPSDVPSSWRWVLRPQRQLFASHGLGRGGLSVSLQPQPEPDLGSPVTPHCWGERRTQPAFQGGREKGMACRASLAGQALWSGYITSKGYITNFSKFGGLKQHLSKTKKPMHHLTGSEGWGSGPGSAGSPGSGCLLVLAGAVVSSQASTGEGPLPSSRNACWCHSIPCYLFLEALLMGFHATSAFPQGGSQHGS